MNILIITNVFPYPPHDGTKIQIFQRLRWHAARNDVTLLCIHQENVDEDSVNELKQYCKIHLVHNPKSSKSGNPIKKLLNYIRSLLYMTPYVTLDNLNKDADKWLDQKLEHDVFEIIEADDETGIYFRKEWKVFKVYIKHSIETVAMRREIVLQKNIVTKLKTIAYWIVNRAYEKRTCNIADLCVTLTKQNEQELLELDSNINARNCLTQGVDMDYFSFHYSNKKPIGVCFVGLMDYPPNVDAVLFFYYEILPLIRAKKENIKIYIVGSSPTYEIKALAKDKNVKITGYVKDVRNYVREAGISIVPTRMGGGILNKILESLAMGIPVVARTRSIEGLSIQPGETLLVADSSEEFANSVIRLMNDDSLRFKLSHKGRKYVEENHQWKEIIYLYEDELKVQLSNYCNRK